MYVGDLDLSCTKQNLIEHFKKRFHSVVDAKIITDQTTNISKGYGFVMFSNKEDSNKALTEMNGSFIKGKPIRVSQGKMNQSNQHGKNSSQSQTQQTASQIYGMGMYNGQSIPPGTMLGGLGVQFKPEGMSHPLLGMQPQTYAILPGGRPTITQASSPTRWHLPCLSRRSSKCYEATTTQSTRSMETTTPMPA